MASHAAATRPRTPDRTFWAWTALVCLAFLAIWLFTLDATLTHDEAVYVDVAQHPLASSFYPEETFLRHPPLGLALLAGWNALELPLRGWPLVFSLGGLVVLADAIRRRDGSPVWLAPAVLAAPVVVPLVTVTLYPPLFFFVAVAAWGWAAGEGWIEVAAWNLAVLTHELALLLLGVLLATRAAHYVRDGISDASSWTRLVWPYPAAVAWGGVMLFQLLQASDGRGSYLATITDPSPNVAAILALKPWVGFIVLTTALVYLSDPREDGSTRARGAMIAVLLAALTAPFYRYVLPVIPLLAVLRSQRPPGWFERSRQVGVVVVALLVSVLALGATTTGLDTLNAGNLPGLVDHEQAAELIGPGETVVVRSSPSFAFVLAEEGWSVTSTADTGPATVVLERGEERIVLHRAETFQRLHEVEGVDAVVFPSSWRNVPEGLPGEGWSQADASGGATRWEPS